MAAVTKAPKSGNLIPVPRAVERAGKTFTQTYWVKAEDVGLEKEGYDPKNPGSSKSLNAFRKVVDRLGGQGAADLAENTTRSWTGGCKDKTAGRAMGTVAALLGMSREAVAKLPLNQYVPASGAAMLEQYDAALKDPSNPLRKALMATYAATQAALKDEGDVIRLQRGSLNDGPAILAAAKALADKGIHYDDASVTMQLNTLNCFTTKDSVANSFASGGVVYTLDVPKSAVLFSYKSTPGHADTYGVNGNDEKEYTVMCQGPTAVSLRNISGTVGQQIYNYFAQRGLTGEQQPKQVEALPKPDPMVGFTIKGAAGKTLEALGPIAKDLGGSAYLQTGENHHVEIPASKMQAFVEQFAKSPAFDPAKDPEKMKAWLTNKATAALAAAESEVVNKSAAASGLGAPKSGWRSEEPSKSASERIQSAVAKLQAELEAAGTADLGTPKPAVVVDKAAMKEMGKAVSGKAEELFGAKLGELSPGELKVHDAAYDKAHETLKTTGDKAAAVAAYEQHVTKLVADDAAAADAGAAADEPAGGDAYEKASNHMFEKDMAGILAKGHFGGKTVPELSTAEHAKHVSGLTEAHSAMLKAANDGHDWQATLAKGIAAYGEHVKGANAGASASSAPEKYKMPSWAQPADAELSGFSSTKALLMHWALDQGHGAPLTVEDIANNKPLHADTQAAIAAGGKALEKEVSAGKDLSTKEAYAIATKAMAEALGKGGETGWHPSDVEAAKPSSADATPSKAYPGHAGPVLELKTPDTPQAWNVKHVGEAKGIGGAGEKHFYESSSGKKWLMKIAAAKGGGKEEAFKASAQVFASKLGQVLKPGSVEVGHAMHQGKVATIQPWLEVKGTLSGKHPDSLTESQKKDVANEHVVDWLTSQHDSHGANLVIKSDGQVVGIDKEQAFKHLGKDKLDVDYHPNSAFGEQEPYYNKFWRSFAEGSLDFDPKSMKSTIDKVKQIPNSHYIAEVKPYAEARFPNDKAAQNKFLTDALARKENIQKDFEKFISGHYEKREGQKGTFTFESGWQPAPKVGATVEPTTKPPPPAKAAPALKAEPKVEQVAHGAGDVEKLPDVPEEQLKAFFAEKSGETPPHRKWYWKKWAEAAMNKAKVPKDEQPEVWKKVLAQGKVMLAKKTIAGQKVSQAQHEAYIKAQAMKKGATPELMPVVQEKPKVEKSATAPAGPPKEKGPGPEHPYQYYWKTWANQAAKEAGGKAAPADVHAKISGLAKKYVAEKQAAGVKFTGKDLEKYIKAAAKKGGEHPGEI